jgi:hypothetical protein
MSCSNEQARANAPPCLRAYQTVRSTDCRANCVANPPCDKTGSLVTDSADKAGDDYGLRGSSPDATQSSASKSLHIDLGLLLTELATGNGKIVLEQLAQKLATSIDASTFPPRGLNADAAARYVGISKSKFLDEVKRGIWPAPIKRDGHKIWDRAAIDLKFQALLGPDETISKSLGDINWQ